MTNKRAGHRIETGVRNLDALLRGGLPRGSVVVIAGPPGAGKTVLTQQICFHNAAPRTKVLYFSTLSEPTAKTLRYLAQFDYFDPAKVEETVRFVDLGVIMRAKGLGDASKLLMDHVRKVKPAIVVVDSFRVFDDLATSQEELRKFGYELAVQLMAWETTTFLLGEFAAKDIESNPLFSIVDGLIMMTQREEAGEQQRFIQIVKMRGTAHSRDQHSFLITDAGVEVFSPRVMIQREDRGVDDPRLITGIAKLDDLIAEGIPRGSSLLVAGVAGTGKTVLSLEFLYRGAQAGEKGIIFSFEETEERLRAAAAGLGWDFDAELERGMIEICFIPQPEIMVEAHLLMMQERVAAMKARRVVVDSVSVFLHKVKDPQTDREKIFQLASIVQNAQAVGFFTTDIPYGANQISRFGVEETVVDGVILLSSTQEGMDRQRYLEVYKLRNTAHLKGRHNMVIGAGGVEVFPRYQLAVASQEPPVALAAHHRMSSGVPGLDALLGGGLLERSATMVSGSAGIGKTTLALQFIAEGARREEPGLYISLEEGPAQIAQAAENLGIPLRKAIASGLVEMVYLSRDAVRANQFLAVLVDKISRQQTRRLVLDSVSQLATFGLPVEELRQILYALVARFKSLGTTTLLTLEAASMYQDGNVTERGFSPITDNLIVMRYERDGTETRSSLSVVKTRGSAHDFGTHYVSIGKGGISVGASVGPAVPARARRRKKSR